jgi:DNA mismatch repair protein MutS2
MIDVHTIETLEFAKLVSRLEGNCLTPYGKEQVIDIGPIENNELIRRRLSEVSQMKDIINFGDPLPLVRIEDDCREIIRRSRTEGIRLDPPEIMLIFELVDLCIKLRDWSPEERENCPFIDEYLQQLRSYPELRGEIVRAIDEDGTVRDGASAKLKSIRNELQAGRQQLIQRLQKILASRDKQSGWQDDVVTRRNDRYVIPVPSGRYESDMGIIHDRSGSGATLYVEPKVAVDMNNRLHLLMQQERAEVDRILRHLTAEIARRAEALDENTRLIGQLDRIHASALLSNAIKGQAPVIDDKPMLSLVESRHPLLVMQLGDAEKVVPTTLSLDEQRQVILVTGPNTGGKTVTLKTVGLSVLMARSGLHISAEETSEIGTFKHVNADIGDEQSLELSLSTFSSHMRNIIHGLKAASPDTLLLLDEIGAGTDPVEGAALAESIILDAVDKGALMLASTHYSQLKTLAMEYPEIENASLEFNRETLAPTYHLHIGVPGASYAIEIAGRLGLPEHLCRKASELVGSKERSLDDLIAQMESDLAALRADRSRLEQRLKKTEQLETFYKTETERLKSKGEREVQRDLDETEEFVKETRREVERLVAEIRRTQADRDAVRQFHEEFSKRHDQIKKRRKRAKPKEEKKVDHAQFNVGDPVRVISFDKEGEIIDLIGDQRAQVRVGSITTTVELRNLEKLAKLSGSGPKRHLPQADVEEDVNREIHLLGMTGEEAQQALEQYLDRAVIAGLNQVYVVHGKGTGRLRRILTEYLRSHRDVASLRLGNWNEGGSGVTVVKLKK